MGSGGSKKGDKGEGHNAERRPSHVDTNPPPKSKILAPCGTCGRKFATDRIQKHAEVCARAANRKRDIFDVQGQRLTGTESEEIRDEINEMEITKSPSDWKRDHKKMLRDIQKDRSRRRPQSALDNIEMVF